MESAQKEKGQVLKVHIVSLGCPKNAVDTEQMAALLKGHDYVLAEAAEEADVVVVNTCGFIETAKEESIEAIMAADKLKAEGRCRGVVVTGCLATRYKNELESDLIEADQILTIEQEPDIVRHVDRLVGIERSDYIQVPRAPMTPKHWAFLRISDGCDHKCAFCAIPAIRGRHKSESVEFLVAEAERLVGGGVRELVLVSQDSMRYGADLYGRPQLLPLLQQLADIGGLEWIRLMYTYPAFWTDELLAFYAGHPKMCKYIDMPLQHIADPVLQRMKRATTKKKTLDLLENIRRRMPGAGLRSSFIVGFPGESEAQFEELLAFVEETRFDYLTAFIYSPEEGTSGYGLDGEVPQAVKEERFSRLTQLQEEVSAQVNQELVGTRQQALVDGGNSKNGVWARMERDAPEIDGQVFIEGPILAEGRFVEVEITGAYPYELVARATGEPY